jgi:hypothetical protein
MFLIKSIGRLLNKYNDAILNNLIFDILLIISIVKNYLNFICPPLEKVEPKPKKKKYGFWKISDSKSTYERKSGFCKNDPYF